MSSPTSKPFLIEHRLEGGPFDGAVLWISAEDSAQLAAVLVLWSPTTIERDMTISYKRFVPVSKQGLAACRKTQDPNRIYVRTKGHRWMTAKLWDWREANGV